MGTPAPTPDEPSVGTPAPTPNEPSVGSPSVGILEEVALSAPVTEEVAVFRRSSTNVTVETRDVATGEIVLTGVDATELNTTAVEEVVARLANCTRNATRVTRVRRLRRRGRRNLLGRVLLAKDDAVAVSFTVLAEDDEEAASIAHSLNRTLTNRTKCRKEFAEEGVITDDVTAIEQPEPGTSAVFVTREERRRGKKGKWSEKNKANDTDVLDDDIVEDDTEVEVLAGFDTARDFVESLRDGKKLPTEPNGTEIDVGEDIFEVDETDVATAINILERLREAMELADAVTIIVDDDDDDGDDKVVEDEEEKDNDAKKLPIRDVLKDKLGEVLREAQNLLPPKSEEDTTSTSASTSTSTSTSTSADDVNKKDPPLGWTDSVQDVFDKLGEAATDGVKAVQEKSAPAAESAKASAPEDPMMMYAGIGGALVFMMAVAVFCLRRRRAAASSHEAELPQFMSAIPRGNAHDEHQKEMAQHAFAARARQYESAPPPAAEYSAWGEEKPGPVAEAVTNGASLRTYDAVEVYEDMKNDDEVVVPLPGATSQTTTAKEERSGDLTITSFSFF